MTTRKYGVKRRLREDGYVDIYDPRHPIARRDGYLMEHRKLAWDSGLLVDPSHEVHHKNHQRDDNRLENFEIKTSADHAREHQEERGVVTNQYGTFPVKPRHERSSAKYPSCGYVRPERPCARCETPMAKRADTQYCSSRCRINAWKERNRSKR